MSPIRFAIIGSGAIASKHAQAMAAVPEARLVAVWSRSPEQGAKFAAELGVEFVSGLEDLAARTDIDAVTVATPSGMHGLSAMPFLKSGKAVLCEKPLEITLEKVDNLLAAAKESNAVLTGVLQSRLGFGAKAMKRAVEEGRFGKLALCSAYLKWWREQSYYDSVGWRGTRTLDGGGALMNQGIHGVDLLQWLAGMPGEVFAFSGCLAHERIDVEDTIAVTLKYPNGALGVIEAATSCKPGFAMRIELCGDKGSAILEDDRIVFWKFDDEMPGDEAIRNTRGGDIVGGSSDPGDIGFEGHRILIEDLARAVCERRAPMIPGRETRNAIQLILSAYESASTGRPVTLSP